MRTPMNQTRRSRQRCQTMRSDLHDSQAKRRIMALLLSLPLTFPAFAQSLPDAGRLLEENRTSGPASPPTVQDPILEAPVRPTLKMPEGLTISVNRFRITGAQSFPEDELQALVTPWEGKLLDINGLNEAAGAITRYYQARGHLLTYAYLPAQKISEGTIDIAVLEGRLGEIEIVAAQDTRLNDEVVQSHLARLTQSTTLSQPDVERRLLLLNDIPGVVARAAFTPGEQAGEANMVVTIAEEEPLDAQLELNNHGARSTGEYRLAGAFHFKNLFGVGDSTRARLSVSDTGDMVSGSLSTRVPIGGDGWTVGAGISRLSYQLGENFSRLGGIGKAHLLNLNTGYPIIRSIHQNLNVQATYDYKRLEDEIQLLGQINPKTAQILGLNLNYDQRDPWLGGGNLAASLMLTHGRLNLDDRTQANFDKAGLRTAGGFEKLNYSLSRQQTLYGPISLYGRIHGQQGAKNLDSSEKLALSGPGAVRAYAPGEATVDRGNLFNLELRYSHTYLGGAMVWSLFHDRGWGNYNIKPLAGVDNRIKLHGSGIGLQWLGSSNIGVNASLGWRGRHTPTAEGGDPAPRLYFQLYKNL